MRYESYAGTVEAGQNFSVFDFTSTGPKGIIQKRVVFLPTGYPTVFNLALGDVNAEGLVPDDKSVSNNGDRDKVLATVAEIAIMYTTAFPDRWVLVRGNTAARTRLYRMAITLNLSDLSQQFEIFGISAAGVETFRTGRHYDAFLVKKKKQ